MGDDVSESGLRKENSLDVNLGVMMFSIWFQGLMK
jgi:hypothetical protein